MVVSDTPAAVAFLRALEPSGPWLLIAINPDAQPGERGRAIVELAEFNPATEAQLVAWIDGYQGRWSLYFTSNLPAYSPFRTAKKEAVRFLRLLHVDVDLPGAADDAEADAALLAQLRAISPPPTAVIFTGGGYQAIWLLAERYDATEHTDRVERLNQQIWTSLGGDACHDVSRLLRLPGTINVPNAKKRARGRVPVLARLVEADWSRRFSLFEGAAPSFPPETLPPSRSQTSESGIFDRLPARLRRHIARGDPTGFGNDRSRLGWHVMCELIRYGWLDEDISQIFLDPANGVSAHYLEHAGPAAYVARNLARARAAAATDWNRNPQTGAILPKDQQNVDKALNLLGVKLTYDLFADRTWVNGAGPLRQLSDPVFDKIWVDVQRECGFLPDPVFFKTIFTVRAREHTYHPVLDYLARVQPTWDGIRRLGAPDLPSWLTTYGGAEDSPYTRAVGRLTLVAAVRRVRQSGCKFDEMLMLISPAQGTSKSTAVRTLAVNDDWFNDYLPIGEVGREVIEHVRGFWIIEAAEMTGLTTREMERVKGFCSRQHDRGRMSYDRFVSDVPRSCVFIGTTNEEALFTDLANRRFWPVVVTVFDIESMRRDLDMLWAEAAMAEASGESIRLAEDLWPAAAAVQASFRLDDAWAGQIDDAIGHLNGRISTIDVYKILNKATANVVHTDSRRLGRAMREIGFVRRQFRDDRSPNPRWFYVRGETVDDRSLNLYVYRDPITGSVTVSHDNPVVSLERNLYGDF